MTAAGRRRQRSGVQRVLHFIARELRLPAFDEVAQLFLRPLDAAAFCAAPVLGVCHIVFGLRHKQFLKLVFFVALKKHLVLRVRDFKAVEK